MGQVQSGNVASASVDQNHITPSSPTATSADSKPQPSPPPSLDSLIAEAAAYGADDDNESLEKKAEKALECPCIAHLRSGPCGTQFSNAFLCFLKSTAEEKGSDCVHPFVDLQNCIKTNPNAFSKDILDGEDVNKEDSQREEEKPMKQHKIIPPIWSAESKGTKQKP
ncbi:unnamed protein product [Cuscuta campestris]|uniref:Mitochondrial intermembrane space import and assembly protein 40 homolog n=2 Tax=Cuscuta sect. Cleistogrammica TaxID=1824901 RepID=A0A484K4M3_9ASTE|nr:hypothetical protein DM860_008132 [Cuscuta australis]VFQ59485.1 unnamed protein product [Cuscuta campestris]